jgi:hypothetical protein
MDAEIPGDRRSHVEHTPMDERASISDHCIRALMIDGVVDLDASAKRITPTRYAMGRWVVTIPIRHAMTYKVCAVD